MFTYREVGSRLILLGPALLCAAVAAGAQNPFDVKQFSATVVTSGVSTKAGPAQGEMKIFRSGDKMRMNLPTAGYMIMDLAQHTNYMVVGGGMCMQMSTPPQQNPFAQAQDATIERSSAGSDTVDGHPCKVENVSVTSRGRTTKMKVWEAEDLRSFPVKVEMQTSQGLVTVLYKDVSFAEPQASLFVHPENCRQMPTMPGAPPQ